MKENELRPKKIFEEYLRLSIEDSKIYFDSKKRTDIPCPGCGSSDSKFEFNKNKFDYASCNKCKTLYQTPRPPIDSFTSFYNNSISSKYWAEVFFPSVVESRREHIFKPRVSRIIELCDKKKYYPSTIIDVGAGHGIFLEEWVRKFPNTRAVAIEPSSHHAEICRSKKLEVIEDIAENINDCSFVADLVVCFEVLEHVYDPFSFIKTLSNFVKPGGYIVLSTLGVDGFDIQVLWDKSNSVSPPHHINFLSVNGFYNLFTRVGLTNIEVMTPGILDVDIVRNAYLKDSSSLNGNRFIKSLLKNESLGNKFQEFLIENNLSSHTWVIAQTPSKV